MSYDLNAAKAKAAAKVQDDLDEAVGETSNNFDAKLIEIVEKASLTPAQKTQFLRQLDGQLTGFLAAILNGQQPANPQATNVLGGGLPSPAAPAAAPDPAIQQERDDLRKKVADQNRVFANLASHFPGVTTNPDGSVGSDFAKRITDASDKLVADAKAAPAGTLLKSDVKTSADEIKAALNGAKSGKWGNDKMILDEDSFNHLKDHADHLVAISS